MNYMLLAAAGAISIATTAQPARAADPVTINCILDSLDAPTRQAMLIRAQNDVQEKPDNELDSAANMMLGTASATCAKRFGWSEKARTAALFYTFVKSGIPAYEAGVQADGFDVAVAEAVMRALPPAQFAGLSQTPMLPGASAALMTALTQAKIALETEKQGFHIGMLAAAISSIEVKKAEFAAS